MIERLTGVVAAKSGDGVVVDVGGVGFLLEVSAVTQRDVPSVGQSTTLFTHLHVREEALQLFGFSSEEERELFRLFLGVSKIALAAGDVALFASVPGIGKKTAERIILELREKMGDLGGAGGAAAGGMRGDEAAPALARAALVELGFSVLEADRLLAPLDAEQTVEELVRQALARG